MAILRLNDDAILARPFADSPELTSRVTGNAMPLDDEQAVVVTLLADGPVEIDDLVQLARHHGVAWDRATMQAFIDDLERWGLLDVEDQPGFGVPDASLQSASYAGLADDLAPEDGFDGLHDRTPVDQNFGPSAEEVGLLGGEGMPADLPDEEEIPAEKTQITTMDHLFLEQEMARAGVQVEDRPTSSGEAAKTIELPPSGSHPAVVDRPPAADVGELEGDGSTVPVGRSARPQLRLVPALEEEENDEKPTAIALKRSNRPSAAPRAESAAGGVTPHPRLLPQWMPKLVPQTRNILLVDPNTNIQRELKSWEYQVARMMQGHRSPRQVAEWARSVGLQLTLEDVVAIIRRLQVEGVLAPGTEPLTAEGSGVQVAAAEEQPEPLSSFSDSPDSIMESLAGMPVPGRRTPTAPPEESSVNALTTEVQAARAPAPDADVNAALTEAAALIQQKKHDEAEEVLKRVLERSPEAMQAMAMLELISGAGRSSWRLSRRALWIGGGVLGLALLTTLILLLTLSVEDRVTLPCRAELLSVGAAKALLGGRVTAVTAQPGIVVQKGQELARVLDEETRRRVSDLRRQTADKKELLRIMRTTGSVADERKQRRLLAGFKAKLRRLARCRRKASCRREINKVKQRMESAKLKLKFCEWQAEPDEIARVEQEVSQLEKALAPLADRPLEAKVASPHKGLVTAVKVSKGKKITKGTVVVQLADPGRFLVVVPYRGEPPSPGAKAQITLLHQGATQIYRAEAAADQRQGALLFEVLADVSGLSTKATCKAEISRGTQSVLASWFD